MSDTLIYGARSRVLLKSFVVLDAQESFGRIRYFACELASVNLKQVVVLIEACL